MAKKITSKDYIAINRDGVFVGGKPAIKYHGKKISRLYQIQDVFYTPGVEEILEIRVMQSDTYGEVFKSGNPNPAKDSPYVWIQAITKYGASPWLFRLQGDAYGENNVASLCAFNAAWTINQYQRWRDCLINTSKNNMPSLGKINSGRGR